MKKFNVSIIVISFLFLTAGCSDSGSSGVTFNAATRGAFKSEVIAAYDDAVKVRGVSVAVYVEGLSMWKYAMGDASSGTAMKTSTPTFAYSITKTLVSAMVLQQIEDGLYELTDTVDDLLSGHDDYGTLNTTNINVNATVEDLLTHSSGMPDYASNVTALIALCDPLLTWEPVDILNDVVDTAFSAANFSSGTFEYSNTNYILLGMIAEEEGGDYLHVLLRETFFSPLEIELVLAPREETPSNIAHPHDEAALFGAEYSAYGFLDLISAISLIYPTYNYYTGTGRATWAAGGIIGTAGNLARWGYELYSPNGSAVSETLRTTLKNSAPGDNTYGYGIGNIDFSYDDAASGAIFGHDGSAPGYKTLLRYEVTEGITVAIITNANNSVDGTGLIDRVALAKALFNAYHENKDLEPVTP